MGDWGGGWKKIYRDFQGRPICQIGGMMLVMTMMVRCWCCFYGEVDDGDDDNDGW